MGESTISPYAGLDLKRGRTHMHARFGASRIHAGLPAGVEVILANPLYKFHTLFHRVLSDAFTNFDLEILGKEDHALILKYLAEGDSVAAGNSSDKELNQLDTFLGSLLEDSDEFCNECK